MQTKEESKEYKRQYYLKTKTALRGRLRNVIRKAVNRLPDGSGSSRAACPKGRGSMFGQKTEGISEITRRNMLGFADEDPSILQGAILYLKRSRE